MRMHFQHIFLGAFKEIMFITFVRIERECEIEAFKEIMLT